jgi:hypothetical protein
MTSIRLCWLSLASITLVFAAGCREIREPGQPRGARGDIRDEEDEEDVRRGTPGYSAPIEILPQPFTSSAAPGWDSERLWSRHVDWEPAIAADPSAPYVYQLTTRYYAPACQGCGDPAIVFRRSRDDGRTWEADTYLDAVPGSQHDPQIEVSSDGTIYAAYLHRLRPGVVLQKSSDLGETWTPPVALKDAGGPRWSDKPWLTLSPDGKDVYIAFNSSDSYVAASHDYGRTFETPVRTNQDQRYWFHSGGAVAPNGDVYFAAVDYNPNYRGESHINVLKSIDAGKTWTTHRLDTSQEMPDCPWAEGCYLGFLGPSVALAIDAAGTIMVAYHASDRPGVAQPLWARTCTNGIDWSPRKRVSAKSHRVNNAFPGLAAADRGDFRLVWQDDRRSPERGWNTRYRSTVDGGRPWSKAVRLSDIRSGPSYKSVDGYLFPYGDYLEIAIDEHGMTQVIWGEGESYDGNGGTWFTRGR